MIDRNQSKEAIEDILDSWSYRGAKMAQSLDFDGAFQDQFEDTLSWMANLHANSPALYWAIFAGLTGLLVLLIWHMVYGLRALSKRPQLHYEAALAKRDPCAELAKRRGLALKENHYLDALRFGFQQFILTYGKNHPGSLPKGATNREVMAIVSSHQPVAGPVERVQGALETAFYGNQDLSADAYEALKPDLEILLNAR